VSTITLAIPATTQPLGAIRIDHGQAQPRTEILAEETAVALVYNGISHAVMMASPLDLEDFALGFSLTEGIIQKPGELLDIELVAAENGITVEIQITEQRFAQLKQVRRNLAGRTGCGLCGQDSLESAIRPVAQVVNPVCLAYQDVLQAMEHLCALQPLNNATGAAHAAGWWRDGQILVREDVGRHNALDKVIGAAARTVARDGVLVISSRASYEIVHKAAAAGFGIVAAISAPTALAVRLAREAGVTLVGFVRGERMTIYSHDGRIVR